MKASTFPRRCRPWTSVDRRSSVQVGTGRILVMAENRNVQPESQARRRARPRSTTPSIARTAACTYGFQGGSTYKPFTLMNWLQHGHGLEDVVDATPNPNLDLSEFKDSVRTGRLGRQVRSSTPTTRTRRDRTRSSPRPPSRSTVSSFRWERSSTSATPATTRRHSACTPVDGQPLHAQPVGHPGYQLGCSADHGRCVRRHRQRRRVLQADGHRLSVISPEGKKLPGQTKSCSVALPSTLDDARSGTPWRACSPAVPPIAARPAGGLRSR